MMTYFMKKINPFFWAMVGPWAAAVILCKNLITSSICNVLCARYADQ